MYIARQRSRQQQGAAISADSERAVNKSSGNKPNTYKSIISVHRKDKRTG